MPRLLVQPEHESCQEQSWAGGVTPLRSLHLVSVQRLSLKLNQQPMQRAFKLSAEARNLDAMYLVLTAYAALELHKAQPHRMLRYVQHSTASLAKANHIVVATHSTAIRIAKLLGAERLAQAYHNYANDLRLLDDPERALAHAKRV